MASQNVVEAVAELGSKCYRERANLEKLCALAARVLVKAYRELNEIRARDGVPYTSMGYASSVAPEYFSAVVDEVDEAVIALTGKPAHCHPLLYAKDS